jgi:hypothetical protein
MNWRKKIETKGKGYAVVNGELYKLGVTEPWLRCITSEKGLELLKEIHSGLCGVHIGTRALAGKAIKQGFYWPTINIDAKKLVQECEACQKIANQQNLPSMPVHLIPPSWPLQRWGMDLVGPTANSSRKLQICSCGRGRLHQMGRSESFGEYHSTNNSEILLAEHSLQIRGSKRTNRG